MFRHHIPTADYLTVTKDNLEEGFAFWKPKTALRVESGWVGSWKRGVLILDDLEEAKRELELMLGGKFGKAGNQVVIEACLKGIELSVFALTDGKSYKILGSAKDYKRIGEGDTGLNTGGMGAVSRCRLPMKSSTGKWKSGWCAPRSRDYKKHGLTTKDSSFSG